MSDRAEMVLVVLYKETLPEGLRSIEGIDEIRFARADELASAIRGADILFLWDFFSTAVQEVWHHADSLKWIHVAAAGVDKLLFPELADSRVIVTNSRGVFDRPIAEFVLASILAMAKDLPGSLRLQQRAEWKHRETERIEGSRVLVVGTGSIGRETARLLKAVGMNVTGVGRAAREGDEDFDTIHASADLASVIGSFDYVVLAAPLTDATHHMVNAQVISAMKPSARLINVGRGELVDEDALLHSLRTGAIAGAALDVFSTEPLPSESPLWMMEQVLISAHLSGDAIGWLHRLSALFIDNLKRHLHGEPLLNVVDKKLGFVA